MHVIKLYYIFVVGESEGAHVNEAISSHSQVQS